MKRKTKKSKTTPPTVDQARAEVARADAGARAAKESLRPAKSSLKAAKKAMKSAEKVAKKARKDARRARKVLEAAIARQRAVKKSASKKRSRHGKTAPAKPVAAPGISRGGIDAPAPTPMPLAPVEPPQ